MYRTILLSFTLILLLGSGALLLSPSTDWEAVDAEICTGLICDEYVVTAEIANVREKPSTDSNVIFTASEGDAAVVLQQQGNWMLMYFYASDSQQGWIHNQLIEHVKTID